MGCSSSSLFQHHTLFFCFFPLPPTFYFIFSHSSRLLYLFPDVTRFPLFQLLRQTIKLLYWRSLCIVFLSLFVYYLTAHLHAALIFTTFQSSSFLNYSLFSWVFFFLVSFFIISLALLNKTRLSFQLVL